MRPLSSILARVTAIAVDLHVWPTTLGRCVQDSGLALWYCHATPWAGMRTGRRQRIAAARAVRGQPDPAVGTDLPVRFELALARLTLVDELVKFLMELQD